MKKLQREWQASMDTWYIAGFYNGFANGPGYGSHIIKQPVVERDTPRCDEFGAHLMCMSIENPRYFFEFKVVHLYLYCISLRSKYTKILFQFIEPDHCTPNNCTSS